METNVQLPLGELFVWDYSNDYHNSQQLLLLAESYGFPRPTYWDTEDIFDECFFYLLGFVPMGYSLCREDGIFGVWQAYDSEYGYNE